MSTPLASNPYAAPRARTLEAPRERTAMYTPTQIMVGTFFGGVAAFIYFLRANFIALGQPDAARRTLIGGIALFAALMALGFLLRSGGSGVGLALLVAALAKWISERHQLTKAAIVASDAYAIHGNWRVFGITLACVVVNLAAAFAVVVALYLLVT